LIATKQSAARPKDLEGISLLRLLKDALERDIPPEEREEVLELVRWFTSRYPTAEERLAYVRQAYARWAAVSRDCRPDGDSPD
jgi:hypothetical protein